MTFRWDEKRVVSLTARQVEQARQYAAEHSLPEYPACDDAPIEDDWFRPDINCPTCEDSGEVRVGEWGVLMPCPDCPTYDWRQELYDDMERGK